MNSALRVENLWKKFTLGDKELQILRGVSFSVDGGELVAITGHSGSGKTTLLHIIGTLDSPDQGVVKYGQKDLSQMDTRQLEKFRNTEIGFVFQFFQLLPEFSALENVMMPCLIQGKSIKEGKRLAESVLEEVGLAERLHHFPSQLSGGEQQRAAIARALVMNPGILLADEPTGNLDTKTGMRVFQMLRDLQKKHNLTSIIVTHNPDIAANCDRVLQLDQLNKVDIHH